MVSFNGEKAMDNYKRLKATQGLIMSLDEQLYQAKQKDIKDDLLKSIIDEYFKVIVEFLNKEDNHA